MKLWSYTFVSEINFLKHYNFESPGGFINLKSGQKGPKLASHVPMVRERWRLIRKGNLSWNIFFLNQSLKILKFWITVVTSSTWKWVKEVQIEEMKIKTKRYFVYETVLSKFWSFDSTWWLRQSNISSKRDPTHISCGNADRKTKSKLKRNFEVRYLFMKLCSQNREILVPCFDAIISKLGQMTQIIISCTTGVKILKSGTIITLVLKFISNKRICEFWNIDARCDANIPKLELSVQNLHLRYAFQLLETT